MYDPGQTHSNSFSVSKILVTFKTLTVGLGASSGLQSVLMGKPRFCFDPEEEAKVIISGLLPLRQTGLTVLSCYDISVRPPTRADGALIVRRRNGVPGTLKKLPLCSISSLCELAESCCELLQRVCPMHSRLE